MKKIAFETIGNTLMMILFSASMVEVFSKNAEYSANGQFFSAGKVSLAFLTYVVLFGLAKWIFSKRNKDYSSKAGEFSAADEREKSNAQFAAIASYKAMITSLMAALMLFAFVEITMKPPFDMNLDLFVAGIILFTLVICIGFLSYGTAWIYKDTR